MHIFTLRASDLFLTIVAQGRQKHFIKYIYVYIYIYIYINFKNYKKDINDKYLNISDLFRCFFNVLNEFQ